jgi:hypothetical protein
MFYWVEEGCGYALVGALPRETLLALAPKRSTSIPSRPAPGAPATPPPAGKG